MATCAGESRLAVGLFQFGRRYELRRFFAALFEPFDGHDPLGSRYFQKGAAQSQLGAVQAVRQM